MPHSHCDTLFSGSSKLLIPLDVRTLILFLNPLMVFCENYRVNLGVGVLFLSLMIIEKVSFSRWCIIFFCFLNSLLIFLISIFFLKESNLLQFSRSFSGLAVLSWYGSTVSWPTFKTNYLSFSFLKGIVTSIDKGIYQGIILLEQIEKRFETLRIRKNVLCMEIS